MLLVYATHRYLFVTNAPQVSSAVAPLLPRQSLGEAVWQQRAEAHRERLAPIVEAHIARKQRGEKHPVMDFLFAYYAFRPAHLLRWSPGLGVVLEGPAAAAFLAQRGFVQTDGGVAVDALAFPTRRLQAARWIRDLLYQTTTKTPFYGCHGLHEWAMVYRTDAVRHGAYPLRLAPEALAAFVEAQPVVCSHYDAFRFFTPAARPLNHHQPTLVAMPGLEQPGCLHTNMDLYRWAFKLAPWVPSELIADAFLLACEIRAVDMRASPYDLTALGYAPIPIETAAGRRIYQANQRRFAEAAAPLRTRLLAAYDALLAAHPLLPDTP